MSSGWRQLTAKFGRCAVCDRTFAIGRELIAWHPATHVVQCLACHHRGSPVALDDPTVADAGPVPLPLPDAPPVGGATTLYVDGGCTRNGRPDAVMIAVVAAADGRVVVEQTLAGGTNNLAELWAVVLAAEWASASSLTAVGLITDSKNNMAWANGRSPSPDVRDAAAVLALQARLAVARQRVSVTLNWWPRHVNKAGQYIEARYGA